MNSTRMIVRSCMVIFWVGTILFFLYAPLFVPTVLTKNSINVLVWPNSFDADYLADFEREMGIKVHVSYFENNEELFVKLSRGADSGYDLVMMSDYVVKMMIKEQLLQKIEKQKLGFWDDFYPALLNKEFDPHNEYTIPFLWGIFGLGVDTSRFKGSLEKLSWRTIFEPTVPIGMKDDAREMAAIAAFYLFGKAGKSLTRTESTQLKQLLLSQKRWVMLYTDMRTKYLLTSKAVPVTIEISSDLSRIMRDHAHISFVIPPEGSFIFIDSLVIPTETKKRELVYQFLNYLYRPEVLSKYLDRNVLSSPLKTIAPRSNDRSYMVPTAELFDRLHFFKDILSQDMLNELWIELKS